MTVTEETLAAGRMENAFRDASDQVERYLVEGALKLEGPAQIATMHLMCRSLADLRAGQYLAGEGFPIQMYSLVRPVIESINLVEVFAKEPEMADKWAAGEHREFTPAKVRERLGTGDDPVYSWMCEHSHPRFAGFQLTTYLVTDQAGSETMRGYIGGLPLELPQVLLATTMPGNVLCQLSLALGHCTVKEEVAYTWPTVARSVAEAVLPGYEAVYEVLGKHGLEDDQATEMIDAVREAIAAATEMEEIVAEEQGRSSSRPASPSP